MSLCSLSNSRFTEQFVAFMAFGDMVGVVSFDNIQDNSSYGAYNNNSSNIINVENNWWGAASGPTHSSNPSGTGDPVSDYLDFGPWSSTPN